MHTLFEMARYYPFWAVPVGLIIGEIGLYFRRRMSPAQFPFFAIAGVLFLSTLIWFIARGDVHSDRWVRGMFGK